MASNFTQISFNVLGGIITVVVVYFITKAFHRLNRRKFKRVFGEDALRELDFHIIYPYLALRKVYDGKGNPVKYAYKKPLQENSMQFSIQNPVSGGSARAIKHIISAMGIESRSVVSLSSDYDLWDRLNVSFISLGGPIANHKTMHAFENDANELAVFDEPNHAFRCRRSGKPIVRIEEGFDYGLIVKLHPAQFPEKTWFTCAGLGEWGTSGAAWYLAYKWKEVHRYARSSPFAIIVKVRPGQDESAICVVRGRTTEEIEEYVIESNVE